MRDRDIVDDSKASTVIQIGPVTRPGFSLLVNIKLSLHKIQVNCYNGLNEFLSRLGPFGLAAG